MATSPVRRVTQNDGVDLGLGDNVFTWDEAKYYQRFIEDQRLLESEGKVAKSSVTVALEHYYEKNPIDDSLEGVLAHYSGMSKEMVAATLDTIEAIVWIADYDPNGLYPVKNQESFREEDGNESENNQYRDMEEYISASRVIYSSRKEYYIA